MNLGELNSLVMYRIGLNRIVIYQIIIIGQNKLVILVGLNSLHLMLSSRNYLRFLLIMRGIVWYLKVD